MRTQIDKPSPKAKLKSINQKKNEIDIWWVLLFWQTTVGKSEKDNWYLDLARELREADENEGDGDNNCSWGVEGKRLEESVEESRS